MDWKMVTIRRGWVVCMGVILSQQVSAEELRGYDFTIPPKFHCGQDHMPVAYMEQLQVPDVNKQLGAEKKEELRKLFLAAEKESRKKYQQDMLLRTDARVYQLLRTNFPHVRKFEREGKRYVFLGDLAEYLNSKKQ